MGKNFLFIGDEGPFAAKNIILSAISCMKNQNNYPYQRLNKYNSPFFHSSARGNKTDWLHIDKNAPKE